jgi:hypothetical protein
MAEDDDFRSPPPPKKVFPLFMKSQSKDSKSKTKITQGFNAGPAAARAAAVPPKLAAAPARASTVIDLSDDEDTTDISTTKFSPFSQKAAGSTQVSSESQQGARRIVRVNNTNTRHNKTDSGSDDEGDPNEEAPVYVPSELGCKLKSHQEEAIRFMWRNVVGTLQQLAARDGSDARGCIIAHSMGLGKTLSVIAFTSTLLSSPAVQAVHKESDPAQPAIYRVLVIAPVNTLQNWYDEYRRWCAPHTRRANNVVLLTANKSGASSSVAERTSVLQGWHRDGGVCIVGYDLFRRLVNLPADTPTSLSSSSSSSTAAAATTAATATTATSSSSHTAGMAAKIVGTAGKSQADMQALEKARALRCMLLDGPDLVIVDEAHMVKNKNSSISESLSLIHTMRRVALTGSPLQNNLKEYWVMVSFVRPGLLGTLRQFDVQYVRPIAEGEDRDASKEQVDRMRKRTFLLNKRLQGVIHRRGVSLLEVDLAPKREFVLFVRLSPLQKHLYAKFLTSVARTTTANSMLFKAYQTLLRVWNHPALLVQVSHEMQLLEKGKSLPHRSLSLSGLAGQLAPVIAELSAQSGNDVSLDQLDTAMLKGFARRAPAGALPPDDSVLIVEAEEEQEEDESDREGRPLYAAGLRHVGVGSGKARAAERERGEHGLSSDAHSAKTSGRLSSIIQERLTRQRQLDLAKTQLAVGTHGERGRDASTARGARHWDDEFDETECIAEQPHARETECRREAHPANSSPSPELTAEVLKVGDCDAAVAKRARVDDAPSFHLQRHHSSRTVDEPEEGKQEECREASVHATSTRPAPGPAVARSGVSVVDSKEDDPTMVSTRTIDAATTGAEPSLFSSFRAARSSSPTQAPNGQRKSAAACRANPETGPDDLLDEEDEIKVQVLPHDWWKVGPDATRRPQPITDGDVLSLSNKVVVFLYLLAGCVNQGEKMLLFSQSLTTLSFLEEVSMCDSICVFLCVCACA